MLLLEAMRRLGVPNNAIEVQMLYGMADPIKEALVAMGQRVRVYTPYGQLLPGMAYLVRRLLEQPLLDIDRQSGAIRGEPGRHRPPTRVFPVSA